MTEFTKIAVTVPTETYTVVERLRRRLGKSRSAVVALALQEWIRSADVSEADRRYIEGYLRIPEDVDTARAIAAQATSHWDAWSPGEPSRASDVRTPAGAKRRRTRARTPKRSRR
jgi:hypothetical protein